MGHKEERKFLGTLWVGGWGACLFLASLVNFGDEKSLLEFMVVLICLVCFGAGTIGGVLFLVNLGAEITENKDGT